MKNVSNWYVVTGGPSSGKSTVLELIEKLGIRVIPEAARVLINTEMAKGKTIEQIRGDEVAFQRRVLKMKIKIEKELSQDQITFFDRAIPDSAAYFSLCGLNPKEALSACKNGQYRKIFLMEQLPFVQDGARIESPEDVRRLNRLLREAYENLGCEVISIPQISPIREVSIAGRLLLILTRVYS